MIKNAPAEQLFSEQTLALLENAPVSILVSALDDYTLLYANLPARALFSAPTPAGKGTCYAAAGFNKPCPFCKADQMRRDEPLVREFRHPLNGRLYQLSGKLVDWRGRPAHIEYITDITELAAKEGVARALSEELQAANQKMQDIVNSIPGGVAIYKISDRYETVYFSDGVPALTGYSTAEYEELINKDALEMTCPADTPLVDERVRRVVAERGMDTFEFRKRHRDGSIVWVRAQAKWIGESEGCPLVHAVFHNITDLKDAQLDMEHMLNSIPGGIASYRLRGGRLVPVFYSDGFLALAGYSRDEARHLVDGDVFHIVHEPDRERVRAAVEEALSNGEALDISYRIRHKSGGLHWVHLKGQRLDPVGEGMRFNVVLTGMSEESRLFQGIANETADAIFVIGRDDQDLLYAHVCESKLALADELERAGRAAYARWMEAPDQSRDLVIRENERFYCVHLQKTVWNGFPAYVKYVRDVTAEETTRQEKERLEQYFQTMLKYLPGGVAVVRYQKDGGKVPEFLSEGFAALTGMSLEQAWDLYRNDALAGVHPGDRADLSARLAGFIAGGEKYCECVYRLKKGDGSYVWVKNTLTMIQSADGESRVYASYHDMTREREEQERLRRQYNEALLQHYRSPGADALLVGHCSITRNCIYEMVDHSGANVLGAFGPVRENFFAGIAGLVVDEEERRAFRQNFLNAPAQAAYDAGRREIVQECLVKLPGDARGRHMRFQANLVKAPDGDVTGIMTATDITQKTISERILKTLSVASYDHVADIDLARDRYTVVNNGGFSRKEHTGSVPYSEHVRNLLRDQVVPRDREKVARMLDPDHMIERLDDGGSYSFSYSVLGDKGDVLTKNATISGTDLRLGRVCLARTDITASVREQQGLLNILAHTFEMVALVTVQTGHAVLHTRRTVLENLPPVVEDLNSLELNPLLYGLPGGMPPSGRETDGQSADAPGPDGQGLTDAEGRFSLESVLGKLREKPGGFDFVLPYPEKDGLRYKQITVLWGDADRKTLCMVRADVTDMLLAERQAKDALTRVLALAEEASQAKSDFLSAMSHDIRTPMNAITGMTALALAHLDKPERVENCLQKIRLSSRHLLSLINDILDMSKIEQSKVVLNVMRVSLSDLLDQLLNIMSAQAEEAGLQLRTDIHGDVRHRHFYGDALRVNQILINILGNAIKFTPEGGRIDFSVEEVAPRKGSNNVRYRFRISDTGIGMSEEFMARVFEPFTRNANTTRVEGSGLGLSIANGLVALMDGKISVESRPGLGTTFYLELEFEQAPDRSELENASEQELCFGEKLLAGRNFLVAEDNALNAEILCELLQMSGAESVLRADGALAVQAFAAAPPGTYDAILMDVQMPNMNGYEATRAIRRLDHADAASIPIVAMTANAFTEDVQSALDAGMNAHVSKPIDMQLLWTTLGRMLRSRKN